MTALLIDTMSLFYRAHYALPPMTTSRGEPTSAIYGFSVLLLKLLREEAPEGLAFALDEPEPTFRHRAYAEYKAGRPRADDTLESQWAHLDALLEALGVPCHAAAGFEADDVLATLARRLAPRAVRIVSGDRDVLQLVRPTVEVLFVGRRGGPHQRYDVAAVRERFGIAPEQLPTYVALVGDKSDNLPGVPGIGPKTAAQLVRRWGDMAAILAHLDEVRPARAQAALREHAERAIRTERLARLVDDVPLDEGPACGPLTAEAKARVRRLFERLELESLLPRLDALPDSGPVFTPAS